VSLREGADLIERSEKVAVGRRVCFELHQTNPTESAFLNKLAEGMVKAGKARYVSKEDAVKALEGCKTL